MDFSLVENFRNFDQSRAPRRIMHLCKTTGGGRWRDFPVELSTILVRCFLEKKTSVVIPAVVVEGEEEGIFSSSNMSIVEFLRMKQTDLTTGEERWIAWIDVGGQRFFPQNIVNVGIRSVEEQSDESSSSTISSEKEKQLHHRWSRNGTEVVASDDTRYYKIVEKLFLSETTKVDPSLTVTSIQRCNFSGTAGEARRRTFSTTMEATKSTRGNANIRFAWYAPSSSQDMDAILRRGFGSAGHGCVHLLRTEFLHKIAINNKDDDVDDRGRERHILLCRVILDTIAKVNPESTQFQPSDDKCDSGADDVDERSRYIIWTNDMHTRVIPECIVSYASQPMSKSKLKTTPHMRLRTRSSPSPPMNMSFSQLFTEIETSLPPTAKRALDMLFDRYKGKKIEKIEFIRQIRSIAGNNLLMDVIKKIRRRLAS